MPSYRFLQQCAIIISIISVVYNGAEGGVSIGFGSESSSRSLVFFGIQSAIEVASAIIVLWRFRNVAKPGEEKAVTISPRELRIERVATGSIGGLLLALALGTEITAIVALALHQEPDLSNASLIISASALVIMIFIWLPKRYLARTLNSSAMQGEATCSLSCIQITLVLFAGSLIFRLWCGGWWVDSATSLFLGLLFGWEGWKMIKWVRDPAFDGGCCKDCHTPGTRLDAATAELGEMGSDSCDCCSEKSKLGEVEADIASVRDLKKCCGSVQKKCCEKSPSGIKSCCLEITPDSHPVQPTPPTAPDSNVSAGCDSSGGPNCCAASAAIVLNTPINTTQPPDSGCCKSSRSGDTCCGS
ncbi:hypothetical protein BD410DRAFT_784952 [Rickenella mellea]|uniref:Uncharacterized protein n=1 Tax=Rickenella mellea TaxID=50990 RepID=A0A4Y7QC34_9AGAM|nr:hypothetical protein BD410DRAFT_784952 [Rickenella mellea]